MLTHSGAYPVVQLTTFIGRERETAAVRQLLREARLVTLTGAGGSGKTRLALEVATLIEPEVPDGVVWVEFAPLLNPELVAHHVADAVSVHRSDIQVAGDALVEALRERDVLLVFDNCEHLVEACARLSERLLRTCPRLRILATSREALGIGGERAWLTPALTLPSADARPSVTREQMLASEAVRLFVDRTRAVRPTFELNDGNSAAVAQICRRLDGLPLAIELAAARTRVLDVEQMAARLDDVFGLLTSGSRTALPRHRTLRGAIDWSHALLSEDERIVFRRLAVFAGGFTIDAAERVAAGDAIGAAQVLDLVSGLVDKSLVMVETEAHETRYRLLETVRQFARERLEEAGEAAAVAQRHAAFYLARAEAAAPIVWGGALDEAWVARLEEDLGNLRAAADWFEQEPAEREGALRLAVALHWFWFAAGHLREGRRRLTAALARPSATPTPARGRALTSLGNFVFLQGEAGGIRPLFTESIAILRDADDPPGLAFALSGLGMALMIDGELGESLAVHAEATALARGCGPRLLAPYTLYWQGRAAQASGDFAAARAAFDEALAMGSQPGHTATVGHCAGARARLALAEGDRDGALRWLAQALPALRELQNHWGAILAAEDLARIAASRGEAERAAELLGAVTRLREDTGAAPHPADQAAMQEVAATARNVLGPAAFDAAYAAGRARTLEQFFDFADAMVRESAPRPAPRPTGAAVLRVRALGPVAIERDGEALPAAAWAYAKPRELLFHLLCHPQGRTREQIGLAFWPEASAAQVKNNFHVTLHHLRKTLGRPDWVVFEEPRYRLNPRLGVEFDAAVFESELRAAQAARDPARLEGALALYRGDFLEGEAAGDWHLEYRERWQRRFVEGLLALGDHHVGAQAYPAAADAYRRVVATDEAHEAAHRQLMLCLARMGERAEAMRHYERLVMRLRTEFAARPERDTTALFERLQRPEPV